MSAKGQSRAFIRREWTADAAQQWTKEDALAAALSLTSYLLIIIGGTLALLLNVVGMVILATGMVTAALTYWIIDPKLRAVSADYETKQKKFLERVEGITRWESRE